jgi:hypothetical protein
MQPSLHASTKRLSRRAFLVRVGEATATLTVVGAGLGRYLEIRSSQRPARARKSPHWTITSGSTSAHKPRTSTVMTGGCASTGW